MSFDPKNYIETKTFKNGLANNYGADKIEELIKQIVTNGVDIAPNYDDWIKIGFALSGEYGDRGRNYFHQISQLYSNYKYEECDNQYNKCLNSKGHGVTMATFYHFAKDAGVHLSNKNDVKIQAAVREKKNAQPNLPFSIYETLPDLLKQSTDMFENPIEKDVFLIGAISVLSGCLPMVEGFYFNEPLSPHLFAFITAPAGSGKGKMKWAKYLGQKIHDEIIEKSNKDKELFKQEVADYNSLSKQEKMGELPPEEPPFKTHFIPANSSSSAFLKSLQSNNNSGIIFETEADVLSGTFKQEWGGFSHLLRDAFHHETASMNRNKEYIELKDLHIAIVLSGTPKQVTRLLPSAEDGLFSRFLYYSFEDNQAFLNPFKSFKSDNYIEFFKKKGEDILKIYEFLKNQYKPYSFEYTEKQGVRFTKIFNQMLSRNQLLLGNDFNANIKRLGVITFRISMIFSVLRMFETGELNNPIICSNIDFENSIQMATTLEKHAIYVFKTLPNNSLDGIKLNFFERLPNSFNRKTYLEIARIMSIKDKTAEKYIKVMVNNNLLNHTHDNYSKLSL